MAEQLQTVNLFEALRKAAPVVTGGLLRMRHKAYSDGAVPSKYKLLAALAIAVVIKCEPCIKAYVEKGRDEYGVSREELIEFLEVAMTMGGCPGEEWAVKALKYWEAAHETETMKSSSAAEDDDSCCQN